ncbi:MAG: DUF523 and DUF1722 domain-containing protein [Methanotrichaceae archaeon]|nr:DUF523 and DUF1722 domain-containing protein [Methanotrichaceae archaeon]
MREFVRPKIIISRCIEFDHCRYDGKMIPSDFVDMIKPYVDFMPICAEVEISLGIPRDPIRIVKVGSNLRLIQPTTGLDLTDKMETFANEFVSLHEEIDGSILKFRSPSCGLRDVKVYTELGKSGIIMRTSGLFGGAILHAFPNLALEDEGRLRNIKIRNHFLTKLYIMAAFRQAKSGSSLKDLKNFHNSNRRLLMAHCQRETKILENLLKQLDDNAQYVKIQYEDYLGKALSKPSRCTGNIYVMKNAMERFSGLSQSEKDLFLKSLEQYRKKKLPLIAPINVLKEWIVRFDDYYLKKQTYFEPYPEELVELCGGGSQPDKHKRQKRIIKGKA